MFDAWHVTQNEIADCLGDFSCGHLLALYVMEHLWRYTVNR
jgi:hypothetical protein